MYCLWCGSECYGMLSHTLRTLLPKGDSRAVFIGYERRLECEDEFFDGLQVRSVMFPLSSVSCLLTGQQDEFRVKFLDIPEYDVGLRQPESFCIFKIQRSAAASAASK